MLLFKFVFAIAVICVLAAFSSAQAKRPEPPPAQVPFDRSLQAVVVTTADWNSIQAAGRLFERKKAGTAWRMIGNEFPAVVGRSGLGLDPQVAGPRPDSASPTKHEGDGRAPAGLFPLTFTFGNYDAGSRLPFTKLDEFTECVDDLDSTFYNKIVNRMHVGNFDWKSSEKMLAVGPQYDLGVFVAYNSFPVVRGNGSCIFLHIWKDADNGTSGCTAMAREDLERIVKWLDPAKNPYLVQMTAAEYNSRRNALRLPKL
jgi:L,D-peptidoglycan transpeptidase YkuD (ErfK/YbiS/YcfS/YnhG family)